jgi:hypothetical protein
MGCEHKSNGKKRGWVFPPLADARQAWIIRVGGGDWDWLAKDMEDWEGEKANDGFDRFDSLCSDPS